MFKLACIFLTVIGFAAEIPMSSTDCVASTKDSLKNYCGCRIVCGNVENLYFPGGIAEDNCEKPVEGCTSSPTYEAKKAVEVVESNVN